MSNREKFRTAIAGLSNARRIDAWKAYNELAEANKAMLEALVDLVAASASTVGDYRAHKAARAVIAKAQGKGAISDAEWLQMLRNAPNPHT